MLLRACGWGQLGLVSETGRISFRKLPGHPTWCVNSKRTSWQQPCPRVAEKTEELHVCTALSV